MRRLAVVAILAISLGGPIVELFDRWDSTFQADADSESQAVVVALCIGVALAIGTVVVLAQIRALASSPRFETVVSRVVVSSTSLLAGPVPTASPPVPLRV
jgi:hypothetical protein